MAGGRGQGAGGSLWAVNMGGMPASTLALGEGLATPLKALPLSLSSELG